MAIRVQKTFHPCSEVFNNHTLYIKQVPFLGEQQVPVFKCFEGSISLPSRHLVVVNHIVAVSDKHRHPVLMEVFVFSSAAFHSFRRISLFLHPKRCLSASHRATAFSSSNPAHRTMRHQRCPAEKHRYPYRRRQRAAQGARGVISGVLLS